MTLAEAKMQFTQAIADIINNSKLPPTMIRCVLRDIDSAVAQLEEEQFQSMMASGEGENNARR